MQEVSQNVVIALLRKKGERRLSTSALSQETGVNRNTLGRILSGQDETIVVQKKTYSALAEWLATNELNN